MTKEAEDIAQLRADCALANKFWGRIFSALGAVTYREKGLEAAQKLWVMLLRQHQQGFYHQGLCKLGIRDDEPPAVKAAKYHYLTNQIGGLDMEYVEESPKKVWIRYVAPMWTYAGVTMLAIPGALRREIFTAWHPRNGAMMGNTRLGWVSTKFIMEGEWCDEGYFIEYDHDLAPGEEFRFEPAMHTPEADPAKAPRLDPEAWPEARRLKATRNWSREYVKTTVECLYGLFGQQVTYFLFAQVMRGIAIQFTHELKTDIGVQGRDAKAVAEFLFRLQKACGQDVTMTESDGVYRLASRTFLPFEKEVSDEIRAAMFEFPAMAAHLINGRISLRRVANEVGETWEIRDEGRWLL